MAEKGQKVAYWTSKDDWNVAFVVEVHPGDEVDVMGFEMRDGQGDTFRAQKVPKGEKGGHYWSPL